MNLFLIIITSLSIGIVIYHHTLYPMLLRWFASRHPVKGIEPTCRNFAESKKRSYIAFNNHDHPSL